MAHQILPRRCAWELAQFGKGKIVTRLVLYGKSCHLPLMEVHWQYPAFLGPGELLHSQFLNEF
jgi:hypothetical protein